MIRMSALRFGELASRNLQRLVQVSRCAAVQVSGFLPAVSFQWRPIVGRLELKGITNVQSIAIKTQR